jgi:hypothetical protein
VQALSRKIFEKERQLPLSMKNQVDFSMIFSKLKEKSEAVGQNSRHPYD